MITGTKNEEVPDCKIENPEEENLDNPQVFKKPADILPAEFKRPRLGLSKVETLIFNDFMQFFLIHI